jgi:hypothetical protein
MTPPTPPNKIDPDAHYRVTDGPLAGWFVTILSVEEDGQRVRALASNKDWVTPPVWLESSRLKKFKSDWSFASWQLRIGAIGLWAALMTFAVTNSPIALGVAGVLIAAFAITFIRSLIQSRSIKSCPICGTRLDPDTWSHCTKCRWDRPMPHFLPAEMRAPWPPAGHKYARLLRKKIDPRVERDHCPRCGSAKWRRSFLSPRWGGRFTCLDCGRVWWPGHTYVIGLKGPAIVFVWFFGVLFATAVFCAAIGIKNPGVEMLILVVAEVVTGIYVFRRI